MHQNDARKIRHEATSRVLLKYKEGGKMYDKLAFDLRERHKDFVLKIEKESEEKGIEQGINKERLLIASNLIKLGFDDATIEKSTGLSLDEIKKVKESNK